MTATTDLEPGFLQALHDDPADETTWLALADWLEESGQADRAELVRIGRALRRQPVMRRSRERARLEARLIELLAAGARPVVPELVNSIGMRLALIPAGRFRMGSPPDEAGRAESEGPMHEVEISRPFYMGILPVTQAQFKRVMRWQPSSFRRSGRRKDDVLGLDTANFPVEMVPWPTVESFCRALSQRRDERRAGRVYRLPTEAEWEYACRAGTTTPFHFGATVSPHQANFTSDLAFLEMASEPNLDRPSPVGSYPPNAWGLHDMHGNVFEWCADRYNSDYYANGPRRDPSGPKRGKDRLRRGGAWSWKRTHPDSAYPSGSKVLIMRS